MKKRKRIFIGLAIVLLLAGTAVWYVYKEYNRVLEDTAVVRPDYSITATRLIGEFEKDEHEANEKYWDKVIQVKGLVKEIKPDDHGFYSVVLGDTSSMSSVRCSMDSLHNNEASLIQKGKLAVMKGVCSGFNADDLLGSDVILVRAVVDSKK